MSINESLAGHGEKKTRAGGGGPLPFSLLLFYHRQVEIVVFLLLFNPLYFLPTNFSYVLRTFYRILFFSTLM